MLELLSKFEMSANERVVLNELLQKGAAKPASLAKQSGLKRPTVYAALDSLISRGLVVRERKRSGTSFSTIPVDLIPRILEEQARRKFHDATSAIEGLKAALLQLPQKSGFQIGGFEVTTYEGLDSVYAYMESVITSGDFSAFICPQELHKEQLRKSILHFLAFSAKTKAKIREIAPKSSNADWYRSLIKNKNHEVRLVGSERMIISDIIFSGGSIVLTHYDEGRELLVRIRERHLYATLLSIFDALWDELTPSRESK